MISASTDKHQWFTLGDAAGPADFLTAVDFALHRVGGRPVWAYDRACTHLPKPWHVRVQTRFDLGHAKDRDKITTADVAQARVPPAYRHDPHAPAMVSDPKARPPCRPDRTRHCLPRPVVP
jgi:hypothetical protein